MKNNLCKNNSKILEESQNNLMSQNLKNESSNNISMYKSSPERSPSPPPKHLLSHKSSKIVLKNVGLKDYLLYFFRCRKNKGTFLSSLSEQITVESLSCDNLIKNNMNLQKLIELLDEQKKVQFYQLKPK